MRAIAVAYVTQIAPRLVTLVTYGIAPESEDEHVALETAVQSVRVE